MKKILSSVLVASTLSVAAFAGNPQTGCGLGSVVITQPNNAILFALQATLNGISGNQTFGITTGTLGCQKTVIVQNERAIEFVNANMDALSNEIALGNGEHLDTLAELLDVKDVNSFKANLRTNYLAIYNDKNVQGANVLDNISVL